MRRFDKVELPTVELGDLKMPMMKGPLEDWLKKLVRRVNAAIESLVAGINAGSGLFAQGEEIEIGLDNDEPYYENTQEIAVRHHLGTVPRGFLITWAYPHRITATIGATSWAWRGGLQPPPTLCMGETPWTAHYAYFYPATTAIEHRLHFKVFLIR